MAGKLSFEDLAAQAEAGAIDAVIAAAVDIHGRLVSTRFTARHFLEKAHREYHSDEVLSVPMPAQTGKEAGQGLDAARYGNCILRPDLKTLRHAAWRPGTAIVLCDVLEPQGRALLDHSPRQMLRRQVVRAKDAGFDVLAGTELEFARFDGSYTALRQGEGLCLSPPQGSDEDPVMERVCAELAQSGLPVEGARAGKGPRQETLSLAPGPALVAADNHVIAKHAAKAIASQCDRAVSFLPQWHPDAHGSAMPISLSLWQGREPAFYDGSLPLGVSRLMRSFVAGMIRNIDDCTIFLAPHVNSYKRFRAEGQSPTRKIWSIESRSAAFRLCADGARAIRIECRVPGADANPYLAMATLLAAGLDGIRQHLDCGDPVEGAALNAGVAHIPGSLTDAALALRSSVTMRKAFGDEVVERYVRAAEQEQEAFDRAVTDWELSNGFETA